MITFHPHLWGGERHICHVPFGGYSGKELLVLPNGYRSSLHYHIKKTETFYVEQGVLSLEFGCELQFRLLCPGETLTLEAGVRHRFWSEHDVVIFKEFSSLDDPEDSIRVIPAGKR